MGRFAGKIVAITGAARGQGRSHAEVLAGEGADLLLIDRCTDHEETDYPLGTEEELTETARLVEKTGRRAVTEIADVRDRVALAAAMRRGVDELGGLDAMVVNAGILPIGAHRDLDAFATTVDTNLLGAINTVHAALGHLGAGSSIVVIGSGAALMPGHGDTGHAGPGFAAYKYSKRSLVDFVNTLAVQLGPSGRRINAIHPTNVDTPMLRNETMYRAFRPDLEQPELADAEAGFTVMHALPVPFVQPVDVSHAVAYLASEESRYVTGTHLKVDCGSLVKQGL